LRGNGGKGCDCRGGAREERESLGLSARPRVGLGVGKRRRVAEAMEASSVWEKEDNGGVSAFVCPRFWYG
jgi:hypothetical protein